MTGPVHQSSPQLPVSNLGADMAAHVTPPLPNEVSSCPGEAWAGWMMQSPTAPAATIATRTRVNSDRMVWAPMVGQGRPYCPIPGCDREVRAGKTGAVAEL